MIDGLSRAIADARQALGVSASLIMCFLRHLDEASAQKTLDAALPFRDRIAGVGLDSSEAGNPPAKFARVFARARDAGFFLTAHAGEEGPASYVWEALDVLGVMRVDHGNHAMDDDVLVERLARDKMALTVCPLSNLRLRVIDDLRHHPLRRMMDKGLRVTVNSDDPAYFGGYINDNFTQVFAATGLSAKHAYQLAFNSFDERETARHRQRMRVILDTAALQAYSMTMYAGWREVVAAFVAQRLGAKVEALVPQTVAWTMLGVALSAYENWLADETVPLAQVLGDAFDTASDGLSALDVKTTKNSGSGRRS